MKRKKEQRKQLYDRSEFHMQISPSINHGIKKKLKKRKEKQQISSSPSSAHQP